MEGVLVLNALIGLLIPCIAWSLLPTASLAEAQVGLGQTEYFVRRWFVEGKAVTLQGNPIADATVEVVPLVPIESRILKTDSQGEFETEYALNGDVFKEFSIRLMVTKKGFLKAQTIVDYQTSDKPRGILITLRDTSEDPTLLRQDDLVSALAPRLRSLGASDGLSAASENDYARGLQELFDRRHPETALPLVAKVPKRDTRCVECLAMLALAELDAGDWDGAYRDAGEGARESREARTLGRAEPLLILGVMESWKHEPAKAAVDFADALSFAPQDALALQEMGRAQTMLRNWTAAGDALAKAINAGAGPDARLMLVKALLEGGHFEEADQEMIVYFDGHKIKDMPVRAQSLWAQVQKKKEAEAAHLRLKSTEDRSADYFHEIAKEIKGLEPANNQDALPLILGRAGANVEAFFRNFMSTMSVEEIHQKRMGVNSREDINNTKSNYLLLVDPDQVEPGFKEYRTDSKGKPVMMSSSGDFLVTSGFASDSIYFEPKYQSGTTFRYLGQKMVNKRELLLVGFAQRPDPKHALSGFQFGDQSVPILVQGVAWIDPANYQIVRLRTDLLAPQAEVRLERLTTDISYREVQFSDSPVAMWLPHEVIVTVKYENTLFQNQHRYTHYKHFNVETGSKNLDQRGREAP
ncbi:MAG TPA: hypothetical protein VKV95_04195 [Terriglobia bacterium]|nr:hypothetical protein [Terriglobia bacterium]